MQKRKAQQCMRDLVKHALKTKSEAVAKQRLTGGNCTGDLANKGRKLYLPIDLLPSAVW